MNTTVMPLARQSLARALTPVEVQLAGALESVFATGQHSMEAVAAELQKRAIPLPSGAAGVWSAARLEDELRRINASLDAAYSGQSARLPA